MRNLLVRFKVCDVHIPEPQNVLNELYGNAFLQGEIIDLTHGGLHEKAYVVVKVEGVKHFLIIPLEKVIVLESGE